jgi:hypothetical protein
VVTIEGLGSGATATAVVENGAITAINVDATGSGYTTATVTIAEPPAPYVVDYDAGAVSVTYETAPAAGTEILATYDANDSSIVGALSAADSHWLELSVDGVAQSPRERVLSVPFAQVAGAASDVTINFNPYQELMNDVLYQFDSAGFVFGEKAGSSLTTEIHVGTTPYSMIRVSYQKGQQHYARPTTSVTLPVPKDYYWRATGFQTVRFIPLR